MELFNETKNNYYLTLIKLINYLVANGQEFYDTDGNLRQAVTEEIPRKHNTGKKYLKDFAPIVNSIFKEEISNDRYAKYKIPDYISLIETEDEICIKDDYTNKIVMTTQRNNEYDKSKSTLNTYPLLNKSFSILPCRAELTWLKTALNDERAQLFFTKNELEHLKSKVSELNNDDSFDKYIVIRHEDTAGEKIDGCIPSGEESNSAEEQGKYASNLNTMLKCIHENRSMLYSYNGQKGKNSKKENDITVPYKIEYSVTNDELKLSSKPNSSERPVMGVVKKYYNLEALDVNEVKPSLKDLTDERKSKKPLVLTVHESTDSDILKQILIMFAKYNREVSQTSNSTYKISINYYSFLEDNLINEIISFGPKVVIESPYYLKKEIAERISDPFNW